MDVTLALHRAVHGYAAGTVSLAALLQISQSSLLHKVNPRDKTAHCSPEEVVEIMRATGDRGALMAMAQQMHCLVLPLPDSAEATPDLVAVTNCVKEFGEFIAEAASDLSDGNVTGNELARIERDGVEALAAIQAVLAMATEMHAAGRRRHLRGVA